MATVLIVTADQALLVRIQEVLARAGLTCLIARSGRAALEALSQDGVDLLLIDLPLPDLSGQELLEWNDNAEKPVPFIVLVAPGEERLGLELMREGARDCLLKEAQLLERVPPVVERTLQRLEQQRQLAAAQEALRQSEARHRALFELAPVGMMEGDPHTGRFLRVNETFCQITGYSEQELRAKCSLEITHPEDREADWQAYQRAVRGETRDYRGEKRYLRKDGSAVWVRVNVFVIRDAQGQPVWSVGVAEEITERKRAEGELQLYRDLFLYAPTGLCIGNADGLTVGRVNPAFARMHGYEQPEAVESQQIEDVYAPEERPKVPEIIRRAHEEGHCQVESVHVRKDGSRFPVLIELTGVQDEAGRLRYRVASTVDLSERKRAEEALREREAQLAFAQRIGRIGVWGRDLVNWTSFVTPEWCDIVGIQDPASVRSLPDFPALVHPDDRPRVQAANQQVIERGHDLDLELRVLHPERGERWMLARARRLPSADGRGHRLLGVIIDITEQKRTEEALRASEERLRFAAQAAGFGIYELDLATGQAYRSPDYKALFGLRPEDEFQLDADHVPIYVHPDDRALVREATRESRDSRGSGTKDVEYRVMLPDGTVRWLLVRGRTSFEGAGKARRPVRSRGIALDVTGRKQLEQEILEISGREQRRIGHDLHDDLCQRLGGLQLLSGVLEQQLVAEGHPRAPQASRILALVQEALERARLLARGLAPVAVEEGGLTTALQGLADNSAQLFRIQCEFRAEVPVGIADAGAATHLYRIAQEAISNAVKHGHAKRVVIGLTDAEDCFNLKVVDDGRGFGRTKATTVGMGLRIMKYRAAMLGATLQVHSTAGHGTTVICAFAKRLCSATRSTTPRVRVGRGSQAK